MQKWKEKYVLAELVEPQRCTIQTPNGQCPHLADWQFCIEEKPICYHHMNIQVKIFRQEYADETRKLDLHIQQLLHRNS